MVERNEAPLPKFMEAAVKRSTDSYCYRLRWSSKADVNLWKTLVMSFFNPTAKITLIST